MILYLIKYWIDANILLLLIRGDLVVSVDSFQEVLNESSSKGNQHKFYKDGLWVKIDNQFCYEGLAEEFVSLFEECIYDFPFVRYRSEMVEYNDNPYLGCYSYNMYNMYNNLDVAFISCRRLFRKNSIPLNIFIKEDDIARNVLNVVESIYSLTSLNILEYLGRLLMLDCLIINEDRHYMNIGVCQNIKTGAFGVAPCFDNGSSLFCTNWTYRKSKTFEENIQFAKSVARPFSKFFDNQLDAVLRLGCKPLVIDKNRVRWLINNYSNKLYPDEAVKRVKDVLINRLNYYEGVAFRYT